MNQIQKPRIYTINFAHVYPAYIAKAEKKGRTKAEINEIITWLTDYCDTDIKSMLDTQPDFETFIANAPNLNPARDRIKGMICGMRVEYIEDKTTREIRYLDKLIDELARGKSMEKILRN
ncbi:MAG: hypothetical protein JWN75_130 [Candidatus Saccharibacteria bacterium]|nr:hypothetical protein [Candidatus Saccharibacteria bacterium]